MSLQKDSKNQEKFLLFFFNGFKKNKYLNFHKNQEAKYLVSPMYYIP